MRILFWGSIGLIFLWGRYMLSHQHTLSLLRRPMIPEIEAPSQKKNSSPLKHQTKNTDQQLFLRDGLTTNTVISSIHVQDVLDGGPGKDGIPAIYKPVFISHKQVQNDMGYLTDEALGIVVVGSQEQKFYPYAIMNWHEIVNDEIDGNPIAVTFCPLCGSAIVFERQLDDGVLVNFGVSGKLYQSNLLMYDDVTETLWLQARGKGVVGAFTDKVLVHIDSDVMTYSQFQDNYPSGIVLSDETGYTRNYAQAPYGDYDVNDRLFFPVENIDARLPKKEILYVVNDDGTSVAFVKKDLVEASKVELDVDGVVYRASFEAGKVTVMRDGNVLPGYHEMFFSWATHNPKSKNLWVEHED